MDAEKHYLQTIIEWRRRFKNRGRKNKVLKNKIQHLEKEANWLAEQLLCCTDDNRVDTCQYVSCRHLCANTTVQGWRKAAREAVKDN